MGTFDRTQYKDLYISTSRQQVENIQKGLDMLKDDRKNKEGLELVYINAHTLVSKSVLMGYMQLANVAKEIEKLFHIIIQEGSLLSDSLYTELINASSLLQTSLEQIRTSDVEMDTADVVIRLQEKEKKI